MSRFNPPSDYYVIGTIGSLVYFHDGERTVIRHTEWDARRPNSANRRKRIILPGV